MHFRQIVRVESGKVVVDECRYIYSLSDNPDDEAKWLFRYDYSITPDKMVPYAHIHLNATSSAREDLRKIHFPTGRLSIEQILAHLICERGTSPKNENWFEILAESHKGFLKRRQDLELGLFP